MEIRRVPLDSIKPAEYNPRKDLQPGDAEYEKIRRSLEEFSLVEPLVWNERTGNLVGGHQRLKVLQSKGVGEVEVSVVDLSPERERALNLALNKAQGFWDDDKLASLLFELQDAEVFTGFDDEEIEDLLQGMDSGDGAVENFDLAAALELIDNPRITPGEVWLLGNHRLICGDSLNPDVWARVMGSAKADLCVTSPPYNQDIKYRDYDDKRQRDEYLALVHHVGSNLYDWLEQGRFVAWNVGVRPETYPHYHVVMLEGCGFSYYRQIIWEKVGVPWPLFSTTARSRKARRYNPNFKHEAVYVMQKPEDGSVTGEVMDCPVCDAGRKVEGLVLGEAHEMVLLLSNGSPEKGGKIKLNRKYANDVWLIAQGAASRDIPTLGTKAGGLKKRGKPSHMVKAHPAAFPVELPRALMGYLTTDGETVVDPFLGAGATLIAAEELGRVVCGIELDPVYCELTMQRWENMTGQAARKE